MTESQTWGTPLAAQHEGLQHCNLGGLGSLIHQHILKGVLQPAEDAAPRAGQRGEHHLCLLHKGQLQVLLYLQQQRVQSGGNAISVYLHNLVRQTPNGHECKDAGQCGQQYVRLLHRGQLQMSWTCRSMGGH